MTWDASCPSHNISDTGLLDLSCIDHGGTRSRQHFFYPLSHSTAASFPFLFGPASRHQRRSLRHPRSAYNCPLLLALFRGGRSTPRVRREPAHDPTNPCSFFCLETLTKCTAHETFFLFLTRVYYLRATFDLFYILELRTPVDVQHGAQTQTTQGRRPSRAAAAAHRCADRRPAAPLLRHRARSYCLYLARCRPAVRCRPAPGLGVGTGRQHAGLADGVCLAL